MHRPLLAAAAALALSGAAAAQDLDAGDAGLQSAQNLADLCAAGGDGADAVRARIFCHGYVSGLLDFHGAIAEGTEFSAIACPGPGTSRGDVAQVFVVWAGTRSDLSTMTPLEGVIRATQAEWPCA